MKNFYCLIIFLIFSINAFPQITIKEKVKIKPGENLAASEETEYTPCGPFPQQTDLQNLWQVVWNSSAFFLDPYQQLFNYQGNASFIGDFVSSKKMMLLK